MSDLYYVEPENQAGLNSSRVALVGDEARRLVKVMRKKEGDEIEVFDGRGLGARARVASIARDRVELDVLERILDDKEPDFALTALVALPKGDRQKWAIEKLTELGVRCFIPLAAERADVKFDADVRRRLERQALEASKQCGRLRVMEIASAVSTRELAPLVEILDRRLATQPRELSRDAAALAERLAPYATFDEFQPGDDVLRVVAHPISDGYFGQISFGTLARGLADRVPRGALLLIGPIGGFADDEVRDAVDGGWTPLDLGKQVYRVETAAIAAAALFLHLA